MALVISSSKAVSIPESRIDSIKFAEFACFVGLVAILF